MTTSSNEKLQATKSLTDLLAVMRALRDPETGCPWDIEQDFKSIVPYTIEEAYEVADAIARDDLAALKEELGDLLLQVVYHAQMAGEQDAFTFDDVVDGITRKMIRRHPHVFGTAAQKAAGAEPGFWERQKDKERAPADRSGLTANTNNEYRKPSVSDTSVSGASVSGASVSDTSVLDTSVSDTSVLDTSVSGTSVLDTSVLDTSVLDNVPLPLPALMRAVKLQNKAARVGFDWPSLGPVFEKMREELIELEEVVGGDDLGRIEEEYGDLLFVVANVARHLKIDPEHALRGANNKFTRRFQRIEALLLERGKTPAQSDLEEMDTLWDQAKLEEKK